jgi:uncharacterized protein YaaQ
MAPIALDRVVLLMITGSRADLLTRQLNEENFRFTLINSSGGVLQESMVCLMIGFHHERMQALLDIIRNFGRSYIKFIPTQAMLPMEQAALPMVEAQMGGAEIYMMNVDRFEQI